MVEVRHPDDQTLLAYIRQQPYADWPGGMQQHIADCAVCQQRYITLLRIGSLLEAWAHSRHYQAYPSLIGHILQQIDQSESSWFGQLVHSIKGTRTHFKSIPVTVALLLLFCVVLLALVYWHVPLPAGAGSDHLIPTATVVVPLITPQPYPTQAAQPMQPKRQKIPTTGATPTNSTGALPKVTPTSVPGKSP